MAVFAVWADAFDAPVLTTRRRAMAFDNALDAERRRLGRVAVYDDAGRVFSPSGRTMPCPECRRSQGHRPGPPHCRRRVESLI